MANSHRSGCDCRVCLDRGINVAVKAIIAPFDVVKVDLDGELKAEIVKSSDNEAEIVRWAKRMNILMQREDFMSLFYVRHGNEIRFYPY